MSEIASHQAKQLLQSSLFHTLFDDLIHSTDKREKYAPKESRASLTRHKPMTSRCCCCCCCSSLGTSGFSKSLRNSSRLSASPPFLLFLRSSGTRGVRQRVKSYKRNITLFATAILSVLLFHFGLSNYGLF